MQSKSCTFRKIAQTGGLKILSGYIDAPAHVFYLIIETDKIEKIKERLAPAITTGVVKTSPVIEYKDILARRLK